MARSATRSRSDQTHDQKTKDRTKRATYEKDKGTLRRDRDAKLAQLGNKRAEARQRIDTEHRAETRKVWDEFNEQLAKLRAKNKPKDET